MTVHFEIEDGNGLFWYRDEHTDVVQEFDDILDQYDANRLSEKDYMKQLMDMIDRNPEFIDGHVHLGYALLDQGKTKKALDACLRGISIGRNMIPSNFDGHIEWLWLDNRPFLRALRGAVLCYIRLRQRRNAVRIMENMLAWNPNDNQGVRFLIGSEYLRLGEIDKARSIFKNEAAHYPPYHYELALSYLQDREYVLAATSLRRGFVSNGYIAELLSGHSNPRILAIWHGSNLKQPEIAWDYVLQYKDLWQRSQITIAFLHWLYNHPEVLVERAAVLACQEELLWERDIWQRRNIGQRMDAIEDGIDDQLSTKIVIEHIDRTGRAIYPWLYTMDYSRQIDL